MTEFSLSVLQVFEGSNGDATMNKPIRVQRKRLKGWRMPPNTMSVCRPGKWGNPFKVGDLLEGKLISAHDAVNLFAISMGPARCELAKRELRGFNLACYCGLGAPCHAEILLRIANE